MGHRDVVNARAPTSTAPGPQVGLDDQGADSLPGIHQPFHHFRLSLVSRIGHLHIHIPSRENRGVLCLQFPKPLAVSPSHVLPPDRG